MEPSYLEIEKPGSLLFRARKIVSYLFGEKKVDPCNLETKKSSSQLFGARKKRVTAISRQKNCFAAICGEKKVDPCYLENQFF